MWLRGDRHNPLSQRYIQYMDNRPILPQDPTQTGWLGLRKLSDPYRLIYYYFLSGNGQKILLSNNIPASDRETMNRVASYHQVLMGNVSTFSIIPAVFLSGGLFSLVRFQAKYMYAVCFFANWYVSKTLLGNYLGSFTNDVLSYYYYKYSHLAVENLNQIEDPRRKFFRPDTTVYYRETPQEIYDRKNAHMLHDSTIYYGPHPYDDHENVNSVLEINNKFMDGHSALDHGELLLGEPIDIKRRIRTLPTIEEYKKI